MKTSLQKEKLLESLRENHIILVACRKLGIGKTTYYRWRKEDPAFASLADEAIQEGVELVNDAAESNIIVDIKNRDPDASKFWLKHRHPAYSTKIRVEQTVPDESLSPEQEALVRKALAGLTGEPSTTRSNEDQHDKPSD